MEKNQVKVSRFKLLWTVRPAGTKTLSDGREGPLKNRRGFLATVTGDITTRLPDTSHVRQEEFHSFKKEPRVEPLALIGCWG